MDFILKKKVSEKQLRKSRKMLVSGTPHPPEAKQIYLVYLLII